MSTLLFKEQNEPLFWQYWQEIWNASDAGPRHHSATPQSWDMIARDQKILQTDKSFVYFHDGRPVAAVYFPLLKQGNEVVATAPGEHLYEPLVTDKRFEKDVFHKLDEIALENSVTRIAFQIDPLAGEPFNYLQKYGYLDISTLEYVFDLTVLDFLGSCRKGHRFEIKKILHTPGIEIFHLDETNPDRGAFEGFRALHRKMAGKITRPRQTFDLQFEKIQNGQAVLFGLNYQNRLAAFTYFDFRKTKASYATSVHDPDLPSLPFGHALIYRAAEYLKKHGVRFIDTEPPCSPSMQFGYYPDQKQRNIALFKRGFAGRYLQNFRGVKFFSKSALAAAMKEFVNNYQLQYEAD